MSFFMKQDDKFKKIPYKIFYITNLNISFYL